jgi:agmatine/peptidylarginine deiminase
MNKFIQDFRFFIVFAIILAAFSSQNVYSQNLPVGLTPQEKLLMPTFLNTIHSKGISNPPSSPVRTAAEWEEIDALTITWTSYTSVLAQIVKYAQMECKVIINCSDSNSVKTYLTNQGVPITNVAFIKTPFNSVWIRDYGAQNVYTHDVDSLLLIDWVYNRPSRPSDDTIPRALSNFTGLPLYETKGTNQLINTGGNFMADGFGNAFSSNLVVDENPTLTAAQIDTIVKKFMGLKRYVHMPDLPYDGIHHIDMHMKLLNEETLLVGQYPIGVADGPQIESNLQYVLQNYNSVFGTPYKVVRIPMPPDNLNSNQYPHQNGDYLTYTNSVFVNKTVLVPTYYEKYDTTALRIYRESLPGYKIVGINCSATIPASGAIHCITNSVASKDPLLISHQQLNDLMAVKAGIFDVEAKILHRSGIQSATLYYRWDTTQAYIIKPMTFIDTINNIWTGHISQPNYLHDRIYYYIKAIANSGKTQVRPITAPDGTFSFLFISGGINENSSNISLSKIYPNPTNGMLNFEIESAVPQDVKISVYSVFGQKIAEVFGGKVSSGTSTFSFNTAEYSNGVYMIKMESGTNVTTKRFIKQ